MATATILSDGLDGWAPGTQHYRCSDGKHLAVEATTQAEQHTIIERGQSPDGDDFLVMIGKSRAALKLVVRPTVVFLCDERGCPVDADENDNDPLTPISVFPAGTTHDEALTQMGYTLA